MTWCMPTRRSFLRLSLAGTALLLGPRGLGGAPAAAALKPDQVAAVLKAENYLTRIRTLRSRFVQVSSNGAYTEGEVLIKRPGRMRFEYDPPNPILLVADGLSLLYYDKELKQATFIPLWETPLWFLIRKRVDLSGDIEVKEVVQDAAVVRITVQEKGAEDIGAITLMFSERPFALRSWEITDAQGITTQLTLLNPDFDAELDSSDFDISEYDVRGFKKRQDRR